MSGISAALPPGVSPDGECCDMVNMRNENGAWHVSGAPERVVESDSDRMQLTLIHSNMGYRHIVCYDGRSVFWEADMNGDEVTSVKRKIADIENVKSLSANGNFVVAVTGCECRYILFINNDYVYMGGMFMPELMFCLKFEGTKEYANDSFLLQDKAYLSDNTLSKSNNALVTARIQSYYDKAKSELRKENCFLHPFLVRYAIRLFDGSHVFPSPPILLMPDNIYVIKHYILKLYATDNNDAYCNFSIKFDKYAMQFSCASIPDEEWDDIIDGVDIFISDQKNFIKDASEYAYWFTTQEVDGDSFMRDLFFTCPVYSHQEKVEWIEEESMFFKVASYSLAELREKAKNSANEPFYVDMDADLEFLTQQDNLDIDNFSLFDNGADVSFTYNSHLHLGGIYQYFPKPFPLYVYGIRQNTFYSYTGSRVPEGYACYIDVTLKCNDGIRHVITESNLPVGKMLSPFISYPDSRATNMTIRLVKDGKEYRIEMPLQASRVENSANYLNESFMPLSLGEIRDSDYVFSEERAFEYYPNRIKVSETDNMIFFPQEQTYTVSEGKILKMASATRELSQGQYGEFPLYVFTDEGVWAMQQGDGSVLYATQHPINRDVPLSSDVICGIDNGVAYISEHGLTVLSGSNNSVVDNSHDGVADTFDEVVVEGEDFDIVCNSNVSSGFRSYISGSSAGYDYVNNELLFLRPGEVYFYAFNIESRVWCRRVIGSVPLKCFVNAYPNLWICDDSGVIFNLSAEDRNRIRPFAFVTRCIKGIPFCSKQLREMILNIGNFSDTGCSMHVDILASELPDRGFRNILRCDVPSTPRDMLRFPLHTRPFKFFRLAVFGNGNRKCCINNIVMNLSAKYTGKLR